jgi:hypothetical protein
MVIGAGVAPPVAWAASPTGATRGADNARTGWYPDQTSLTPQLVSGGTFGQLFKTAVSGSVYGQPLVDDNQVLVSTETNHAYGLDPETGAIQWSRKFGSPVQASTIGCADLSPNMGITSTPVVDTATNTEYLVDNEYISGTSGPVAYYMHALNLANNGAEQPGFPVQIQGTASNHPGLAFNPYYELQRPGLLLLGGVVYVAFGAHCDFTPYQGWIAGVSEAGHLSTLWTTVGSSSASGAGIWMSGGGLVSDGPGQILFATGNGASTDTNGPIPDSTPPSDLGESVVRLAVQADNSLKATDFFSPYDAAQLDSNDIDFGSGSPVALPDANFGTAAIPHLAVEVGKEGYVYLLNRDNLGGFDQGPSQSDNVVGRYGPNGGVWSSPAVWPGDGGWVYIPTASGSATASGGNGQLDAYQYGLDGTGKPTLNLSGQSTDAFGFGSSAPVVTSNGTTSGSALVWLLWSPDGTGAGAQLRAYDPVPVNGAMHLRWSAPVGTASKFNPPGVGGNRIYVGTRDGNVLGFGAPVAAPVTVPSPTFPATVIGQTSTQTVTVTANGPISLTALSATGPFTLGTPSTALPVALATGATISVPVTFTPTIAGLAGGSLTVTTAASGSAQAVLSATGQLNGPTLSATTTGLSFGGVPPSSQSSTTVGFTNTGSQPLTVSAVVQPVAPFTTSGAPSVGVVISPGAQVVVNITFSPSSPGAYASSLEIDSNGGNIIVGITGNSTTPSVLHITPSSLTFGSVAVGHRATETFTLSNVGGSTLTVTKSKPPVLGPFTATSTLPEGTTIAAGASVTETITFTPSALGSTSDAWVLNVNDNLGVRSVGFTGNGVIPDPTGGGWKLNGSSKLVRSGLQLTQATRMNEAGDAFWPAAVSSSGLTASFTTSISGGTVGANGLTFVLANAADSPTALGFHGSGLGFSGISGIAVALDTYKSPGNPSGNFVGVTDGPTKVTTRGTLHWLATNTNVPSLRTTHRVTVNLSGGTLNVTIDGTLVLSTSVTIGPQVLVGFTGGTGNLTDTHSVGNVVLSSA